MPTLTLTDFKRHLRIRHSQDDADLELKLATAIEASAEYLNRPIPWLDADGVEQPVPASVVSAIFILGAELNANREQSVIGASVETLPTYTRLLNPYRVEMGV